MWRNGTLLAKMQPLTSVQKWLTWQPFLVRTLPHMVSLFHTSTKYPDVPLHVTSNSPVSVVQATNAGVRGLGMRLTCVTTHAPKGGMVKSMREFNIDCLISHKHQCTTVITMMWTESLWAFPESYTGDDSCLVRSSDGG